MLNEDLTGKSLAVSVSVATLWESPDLVQPIDEPIVLDKPNPSAWTANLGEEDRRNLASRVLTQLILGEPVEVIDTDGDWVRIVAPWQPSSLDSRGYPGWVRRTHLAAAPAAASHEAVITTHHSALYDGAELVAPDSEATYATILPLHEQTSEAVGVHLPGGKIGWLDRDACLVRTTPDKRDPSTVDRDQLLAEVRSFNNLRYLWGGMSAYGLDCSSLVHIVYRRLGGIVPRDAHDQAAAATRFPRKDARPGELLFFQRDGAPIHHVAFALDDPNRLLHAANYESVLEEPMSDVRRVTVLDEAGRFD